MSLKKDDIVAYENRSLTKIWTLKDKNQNTITLHGCSAVIEIRDDATDEGTAKFRYDSSTPDSALTIEADAGRITWFIDLVSTDHEGKYDLAVIDSNGKIIPINLVSKFKVVRTVTNA